MKNFKKAKDHYALNFIMLDSRDDVERKFIADIYKGDIIMPAYQFVSTSNLEQLCYRNYANHIMNLPAERRKHIYRLTNLPCSEMRMVADSIKGAQPNCSAFLRDYIRDDWNNMRKALLAASDDTTDRALLYYKPSGMSCMRKLKSTYSPDWKESPTNYMSDNLPHFADDFTPAELDYDTGSRDSYMLFGDQIYRNPFLNRYGSFYGIKYKPYTYMFDAHVDIGTVAVPSCNMGDLTFSEMDFDDPTKAETISEYIRKIDDKSQVIRVMRKKIGI